MHSFYQFPSPAKINLFLHVIGRRANGYHDLQTLFQFLDYGDEISIAINDSGQINLLTAFADVAPEQNLIVRAAKLLQEHCACPLGADIKVKKVLPMGGGLGGGSSNAATVLLALNALWHCQLSRQQLATMGLSLGADVPIFIHGTAAFAEGVGEQFTPANPPESWYLISKPACAISTQEVFQSPDLPRDSVKITNGQQLHDDVFRHYHNDCETMVIKHYPEVAKLLAWLVEYAPSRMTGTGSCIFSQFASRKAAEKCQQQLPGHISSFVAKGLNRSPLLQAIAALD